MYKDIFNQIGLAKNESIVYDYLLQNGESPAGDIIKKTPLKRGVIYNALADLVAKGLVTERKKQKIAMFSPNHPEKLRENIERQEQALLKAKNTLEANLANIISDFSLVSGKPGVRYFAGIAGIKKVLNDTILNNQGKQLLTFSDVAGYANYLKQWNAEYYAPKRKELGIYEKVIIPDNKAALDYMRNYKANEVTDIIFIDHALFPFSTEINIYDNKVSFVTFSERGHVGVILENKEIAQTLTSIFNLCWQLGKKYYQAKQPEGF